MKWSPVISALAGMLVTACFQKSMTPGEVRIAEDDPIVMIEAGNMEFKYGTLFVRYVVDRATRTCWIRIGGSNDRLRCCELARVEAARQYITWPVAENCPTE